MQNGSIDESHALGEPGDVVLGRMSGRQPDTEITCFKSVGVAVDAVRSSLEEYPSLEEVIFCCFSAADQAIYERLLDKAAV